MRNCIFLMVLVLIGCASVRLPELKDSHPASPKAAEASYPKQSKTLKVEKEEEPAGQPIETSYERQTSEAKPPPVTTLKTYTCPMHPEVVSKEPGNCPKCGMALVLKLPDEKNK